MKFTHEFRMANIERNQTSFASWNDAWDSEDWMTCLLGEIGEAIDARKKLKRLETDGGFVRAEQKAPILREYGHEIADAWTYLDLLMYSCGIDPPEFEQVYMDQCERDLQAEGPFRIWIKIARAVVDMHYADTLIKTEATYVLHLLMAICFREGMSFETVVREKFNIVSDRVGSEIKL